ncbi:hypothetical protein DFH06DRAFT_1476634 [Mycena polygramma]|nr:hypothetical protein DFH06DRAFT_1476634 [Mycena polygramma]
MQSNSGPNACDACGKPPFKASPLLPNASQISDLRDILRSNTLPLEKSGLLNVVDRALPELKRFNAEIARLQQRLAILISDRNELESYSDGCRSAFSPIRRLPTEVLAEIFGMCYPPGEGVIAETVTPVEEVDRVAKKYLLQISQVCSHWHSVVMETPMLWSTIILDTDVWSSCTLSSKTLLDLIAISLNRGVDYPLTLYGTVDHGDPNEHLILDLLSQHSHRWKCVSLWIDVASLPFLINARGHLPLLKTLELVNFGSWSDVSYTDDIFETAPKLTDVSLTNWHSLPPMLPWKQVSPLTVRSALPMEPTIDFACRSSLHATLRVLRIDTFIEEHELTICLGAVPLLQELYISDSAHHLLTITDNLLQQLEGQ